MLRGDPETGQAILAGVIGWGIEQCGNEAGGMEIGAQANQRIAGQRARAALVVEIEMAAATDEQEQRNASPQCRVASGAASA